ncbi:MAG: ABC transporter permease [Desulfobacteraceae bacterium]|jgi:lipopolysaccharide transport system permease protein
MKSNSEKIVIKPTSRFFSLSVKELCEYKDLLYFLVWRDIKVRYKQTVLGIAWVILQPLIFMTIFTLIFGKLARLPSEGIPYPVFIYTALLPWQLFAYALSQSAESLVANEKLITKIYFPRILIPMAPIFSGLFDFLLSFVVLIFLMLLHDITPGLNLLFLPVFLLFAVFTSLGAGLWFTALNVRFRDVRYTIPFLTQIWFYATPVAYSSTLVPESLHWLYRLNPMVGVVEGFRWILLNAKVPSSAELTISLAVSVMFLASGLLYFQKVEGDFADII